MNLREVLGNDAPKFPGKHFAVALAQLYYNMDERSVELTMWPADTLQQARVFYMRPGATERLLALEKDGWRNRPNFHFGFMASGLCWLTAALPVAEYMSYWESNIGSVVQIQRKDWGGYWKELVNTNIVEDSERNKLDDDFTNTQRQTATPRPGLNCVFPWSLAEAERIDSSGKFAIAVKERINQLLGAIGDELVT